jgi:hypothetical protein
MRKTTRILTRKKAVRQLLLLLLAPSTEFHNFNKTAEVKATVGLDLAPTGATIVTEMIEKSVRWD